MIFDLPSDVFKKIMYQLTIRETTNVLCTSKKGVSELGERLQDFYFDYHMFISEINMVIDKNLDHYEFIHSVKYDGANTKLVFISRFPRAYKVKFQSHVTKYWYLSRKRMGIEDVMYAQTYSDLKQKLKEAILTNNSFRNTALYPISKRIKFST